MSAIELARMDAVLASQKAAFTRAQPETMACRRDRIDRAIALLIDHKDAFAKAVSADFGHRSTEQTLMTDIMPSVSALKHARKHFEAWSRNEKRKVMFPLGLLGAKAEVRWQPKGV
ncbi:MAG: coniferyl aldehyde dehydrogenase, partial [Brevundimonas sp.]|nr:coniferyl aldehyde dehydrogenase [Brevundimonas sp.]